MRILQEEGGVLIVWYFPIPAFKILKIGGFAFCANRSKMRFQSFLATDDPNCA
ncbi:MAG: hypothetical protein IT367_10940 [Candidatus Hydrogenedentes bacterium]|nr:hypothetical protein [Candidatus Hydrogenedentota bacterium]